FALDGQDPPYSTEELWNTTPVWEKTFSYTSAGTIMYGEMAPRFEAASRQEFVDALGAAGLTAAESAAESSAKSSKIDTENWETMLLKVDFVAQFSVVRAVHQAMREYGESPELLGLLARGYANLAMLTQHQWNATSEAFGARAILYAQRMVAAADGDDSALWHRAYAWGLVGVHHHALSDVDAVNTLHGEGHVAEGAAEDEAAQNETEGPPPAPTGPEWTRLLIPYLHCDRAALKQVGEQQPSLQPWSLRLWFQLTSAYRYPEWMFAAGRELMQKVPTAYGMYAELAHHGGRLGPKRTGAYYAPLAFYRFLPASLDAATNLPATIRGVLPTNRLKAALLQKLMRDPNPDDAFSPLPGYVAG
ncbi:MAG: hypothetical protein AAF961_17385, partial [Planctomycetota bacterium]